MACYVEKCPCCNNHSLEVGKERRCSLCGFAVASSLPTQARVGNAVALVSAACAWCDVKNLDMPLDGHLAEAIRSGAGVLEFAGERKVSREEAERLPEALVEEGPAATAIHGGMTEQERRGIVREISLSALREADACSEGIAWYRAHRNESGWRERLRREHPPWWVWCARRFDGFDGCVEFPNRHREWWVHGQYHRVGGPAIERPDGYREWWLAGQRHRADGPAIEYPDGYREWWVHGQLHRTDGPAVEYPDGRREWWVHGERQPDPTL